MTTRRLQTVAALTCMKLFLLIFNVIFWVAGIILLIFGLWMKISLHYLFELSDTYNDVVPSIFIGTGCAIILAGFLACCCTIKGQPVLLYILSVFLAVIFFCEIAAVVSGYIFRGDLADGFKTGLNNSIDSYGSGKLRDRDVDMAQTYLKCCGVQEYRDWYAKWGNHTVPQSCCKDKANCEFSPVKHTSQIYTEGCYDKVVNYVNGNLGVLFGSALGIAAFQLFGVILACCLAKHSDKAKYEPV